MYSKYAKLLEILLYKDSYVKSEYLAKKLGLSVRTIKNYVNEINTYKATTISSSREGYLINKENALSILDNINQFKREHQNLPQTSQERVTYILHDLIKNNHSVNSYDLCDELYISFSTLKNDLTKLKKRILIYDLVLKVSNDNLQIVGLEKNKRKLISSLLYEESKINFINLNALEQSFNDFDLTFIKNTLLDTFNKYNYFVNDFSLNNLIIHITIAIDRIRNNNVTAASSKRVNIGFETIVVDEIITKLENKFRINYSDSEKNELILLLLSRVNTIDYKSINVTTLHEYIDSDCINLVTDIIESISNYYYISLNSDDFYVRFTLHINNLLIRSKNNYLSKNPLKDNLKMNCPLIYDISVFVSSIIKNRTGIQINDDEIAYIGFHIGSALENQKKIDNKIVAILYCPSYYDLNSRIADVINQKLSDDIIVTDIVTDESQLKLYKNINLIISTIPLEITQVIDFVTISILLNEKDLKLLNNKIYKIKLKKAQSNFEKNLRLIFNPVLFEKSCSFKNKTQALNYMVNRLVEADYVEPTYLDDILEREKLSSTAFEQFAIPHSVKMNANKTGLSLLISEKPILWDNKQVNIVLILCIKYSERLIFNEIFEPITMIMNECDNINKIIQCNTYNDFIDTMVSLIDV